ncbi:MAG: prolyl oligopeptidase family serine peptidase [Lacunisphaera sp.]
MHSYKVKNILILSVFWSASVTLCAAEKLDLDRITPVAANKAIPSMDFFRKDLIQTPALNGNGTYVAAIVLDKNDDQQLLVYNVATQKADGIDIGGVREFTWLNNDRILIKAGETLYAVDSRRFTVTGPLQTHNSTVFIGVPAEIPLRPLIWIQSDYFNNGQIGGVVSLNTDRSGKISQNGVPRWEENNADHITETYPLPAGGLGYAYLADMKGELAFGFTSQDGLLAMQRLVNGRWEKCPINLENTVPVSAGNKPGEVVVLAPKAEGKPRALQFMDAATGTLGDVLLQDKAYEFDGWLFRDPKSHNIVGAVYERSGPKVVWFSEAYRDVQKVLDGFFPGLVTRIISNDESGRRFLVSTYSDRQPLIFYLVDLEKHTVGLFKNSRPWIDPKRMQPTSIMKFKTRDGHQLDAYVTLPAGASKKTPAPLIVLAHDGPWERDTWGFDSQVQFYVNKGYAVLQPNYRGSSGYDWMFPEEDQWAFRKMNDDVTDATKALISSGLVDHNRIGIMGWGFGAYLAVSGVVNEPSLYRCAVANEGVFDFKQLLKEQKYFQFDSPSYSRLVRKLGDPKSESDKFDAISPLRHIDQVHVPVFVAHYKNGSGADRAQSHELSSALEEHQIPHEEMLMPYDAGGEERLREQLELYGRIGAFLKKNLAPLPTATVPTADMPSKS